MDETKEYFGLLSLVVSMLAMSKCITGKPDRHHDEISVRYVTTLSPNVFSSPNLGIYCIRQTTSHASVRKLFFANSVF